VVAVVAPKPRRGTRRTGSAARRARFILGWLPARITVDRQPVELSLFWRTFFLLALLLAGGVFAWVQTLRALEFEPRAVQSAQQTAGLVNLSRTALGTVDGINRVALIKTIDKQNTVRVRPREPGDRWEPYASDRFSQSVTDELKSRLGPDAVVARSVNGDEGMWVGFTIDSDQYWLKTETAHAGPLTGSTWFVWVGIALTATLVGSVVIARLINRPLRDLSFAASRIREGDLDSRLDENTLTSEIREVNRGFNRMARELAKVEEDRAVMLAGISHDLRTPLARLRLETEMSVNNDEAKRYMAMDIEQLDAIIDKFMDYARPGVSELRPVQLAQLIDREAATFRDPTEIRIDSRLPADLAVMADDTELGRVFSNLFENSRRYGRNADTGVAVVTVTHARNGPWAVITVRDHGPGVAPDKLGQLTTPFFRGNAARTAATGAGLGLAIVEKSLQRMGGALELANATDGGLQVVIRLKLAPPRA
jgi:two-component system, OmpR family, osmolarity sensor histidine kinase EnvZ